MAIGLGIERSPKVTSALIEAESAFSAYQSHNRDLARQTAEKVVEAGGVTDKEVFIFAMHGILPDKPVTEHEKGILDEYDQLEHRFGRLTPDTLVAETEKIYGRAMLRCAGLPQISDASGLSIRFVVEASGAGYAGSVELPLTNVHRWAFNTPANDPQHEDMAIVRLAHKGSYRNAGVQRYDSNWSVGLSEIMAVREFTPNFQTPDDYQFLDRVHTLTANTQPLHVTRLQD